jgi:AcrR family transcriptional regulator
MTRSSGERTAPVGRPRSSGSTSGSPRADIIAGAVVLFAQKGFADTTMSEIARVAGLRQSSLYYWFPRKDLILQALLEDNRGSLRVARRAEGLVGQEPARLFAVLHSDILQLCQAPLDFYAFEDVARSQPDSFGTFLDDYRELHRLLTAIVAEGVASGALREFDPRAAATAALSLNEGLQRRYRQPVAPGETPLSAEDLADLGAEMSVAALLPDRGEIGPVKDAARAI